MQGLLEVSFPRGCQAAGNPAQTLNKYSANPHTEAVLRKLVGVPNKPRIFSLFRPHGARFRTVISQPLVTRSGVRSTVSPRRDQTAPTRGYVQA